jgi:peptidoglycan-associated lipoprotein
MAKKFAMAFCLTLVMVFAASCGKNAQKAIDEAQVAMNEAKDAGAEQYASDEYKGAEQMLGKAKDQFTGKDYKESEKSAVSAKDQAILAKNRAIERKAEADKLAADQAAAQQQAATTNYNVPTLGEQEVPIDEQAKAALKDINFDYDSADLSAEAKDILAGNEKWLEAHPDLNILIEGHCDERGTEEFNLALGEKRAKSVMDYMVSLGIGSGRLSVISYGESMPLDSGHDEAAWAKNRRAHFAIKK